MLLNYTSYICYFLFFLKATILIPKRCMLFIPADLLFYDIERCCLKAKQSDFVQRFSINFKFSLFLFFHFSSRKRELDCQP